MIRLLPIIILTGLTSNFGFFKTCKGAQMVGSEIEFYWNKTFGRAVMDWVVESGESSVVIEADWSAASWGLGAELLLEKPINLKEVSEIQVTAYTEQLSSTKIYATVATPDNANLSFPSSLAYPVTLEPSEFTFSIDKMIRDMPETTAKNFDEDDWQKVDRIKLIFTKPATYDEGNDFVFISDVRIIYHKEIDAEIRLEKSDLDEAVPLPQLNKDANSENRVIQDNDELSIYEVDEQQTDKVVVNEVLDNKTSVQQKETFEKREMTHFQSLEELMNQYPDDETDSPKTANNTGNNINQKLTFGQVKSYESCVKDWKTMDDENKFFFDVHWKNYNSGFTLDFSTEDSIELSDKWYVTFKAQTIDHSKPKIIVTSYYENEPVFSQDSVTLKNKLKTFYIPLRRKGTVSSPNADELTGIINRIKLMCLNTNSGSIKEDVIIIKELQLVKKAKN